MNELAMIKQQINWLYQQIACLKTRECCREVVLFRGVFLIPDNLPFFTDVDFTAGIANTVYTLDAYTIDGVVQPSVGSVYVVTPGNLAPLICPLNGVCTPSTLPIAGIHPDGTYGNFTDWMNFITSTTLNFTTARKSINLTEDLLGLNIVFDSTYSFEIIYSKTSIVGNDHTYRMAYDANLQTISLGLSADGGVSYYSSWNATLNVVDNYIGLTNA